MLAIGTILDQRYELLQLIGYGGMGEVFKAREIAVDRIVAVKLLHISVVSHPQQLVRFLQEGKVLSRLSHPNIVKVYRYGVWQKRCPYLVMEYLQGSSLNDLIQESGPLPASTVIDFGIQLCQALQYAHDRGVIHRDLKPANVFIEETWDGSKRVAKVIDFGLAKVAGSDNTASGSLIGSAHYMSPEQCLGKKVDVRSDVYSLGYILYEALAGAHPLALDNHVAILRKQVQEEIQPIHSFRPGLQIPEYLGLILEKALEKNAANRYQSMGEFAEDLIDLRDGVLPERGLAQRSGRSVGKFGANSTSRFALLATSMMLVMILLVVLAIVPAKTKQRGAWRKEQTATNITSPTRVLLSLTSPEVLRMTDAERRQYYKAWLIRYESQSDHLTKGEAYLALAECPEEPKDGREYFARRATIELSEAVMQSRGNTTDELPGLEHAVSLLKRASHQTAAPIEFERIQKHRVNLWRKHQERGNVLAKATSELGLLSATKGDLVTALSSATDASNALITNGADSLLVSAVLLDVACIYAKAGDMNESRKQIEHLVSFADAVETNAREQWYEDATKAVMQAGDYSSGLLLCNAWKIFVESDAGPADEASRKITLARINLLSGECKLHQGYPDAERDMKLALKEIRSIDGPSTNKLIAEANLLLMEDALSRSRVAEIDQRLQDAVTAISNVIDEQERLRLLSRLLASKTLRALAPQLTREVLQQMAGLIQSVPLPVLLAQKAQVTTILAAFAGTQVGSELANNLQKAIDSQSSHLSGRDAMSLQLQIASLLATCPSAQDKNNAVATATKALEQIRKQQLTTTEVSETFAFIGMILRSAERFDLAASCLERGLKRLQDRHSTVAERLPLELNLAYVYVSQNEFSKCGALAKIIEESLERPEVTDKETAILWLLEIAEVCRKKHQEDLAAQIMTPLAKYSHQIGPVAGKG